MVISFIDIAQFSAVITIVIIIIIIIIIILNLSLLRHCN
jgi:hypothetical protein